MKAKSEFLEKLEARQHKAERAWQRVAEAFNTLHREHPDKAKPLYRIMEYYLNAADHTSEFLLLDSIKQKYEVVRALFEAKKLEHLLQSVERGDNVFMHYREHWIFSYGGQRAPLLDHRKGFLYLAELLKIPGKALKPTALNRMFNFNMPVDQNRAEIAAGDVDREYKDGGKDGQPGINISDTLTNPDRADDQTFKICEAEMKRLKLEIQDFRNMGDDVDRRDAERELLAIQAHVKKIYGKRNRRRPAKGDQAEQIRRAVSQSIQRAVQKIGNEHKSLGKHLQDSVSTENSSWCYRPTGKPPDWTLG